MTESRDRSPVRAADIKELNERLVLGMVFRSGRSSQSEIAMMSGLKAPTVFRIFSELEKAGLIEPVDTPPPVAADKKGRRPTWYATVPGAYRVVGLDFRAGAASVVVEDFSASVLHAGERSIPLGSDADAVYRVVTGLVEDALQEAPGGPLLGFGVGAPGVVDTAGGTVLEYPRIPGLSGFPLARFLEERFGAPVRLANNATVAALAAFRYGGSGGRQRCRHDGSVFALLVRSGVGGAFIQAGVPFMNAGRTAVEIGHLTMDPDGPVCACGAAGCLEAYLAEDSLISAAGRAVAGSFAGQPAVDPLAAVPDMAALDRLLASADPSVVKALEPAAEMAATALRSMRHLFDPDEIIIISRSNALSAFLAGKAHDLLSAYPRPDGSSPPVRGSRWNPILAGRAACDMVFDGFFS